MPTVLPTVRPPMNTGTLPQNLSNLPGGNLAQAVATHPTEGWAAVAWVNQPPESTTDANRVFVKVQHPGSQRWEPAIQVNTLGAYDAASNPGIAIDQAGRIYVTFAQGHLHPALSWSDDGGKTWTPPELLPVADVGIYSQVMIDDQAQIVHLLVNSDYHIHHLERPRAAPVGSAWQDDTVVPGNNHARATMALVGGVVTIATACRSGCAGDAVVISRRQGVGQWSSGRVPGASVRRMWQPYWTSIVATPRGGCLAWGYWGASGNYASCSFDGGGSWEPAKPLIDTYPGDEYQQSDTGSTPTLLYDPATQTVIAYEIYRQVGMVETTYLVYSYRRLVQDHWVPDMAGPYIHHQPALRAFAATARSRAAEPHGIGVAYARSTTNQAGLALVAWSEIDQAAGDIQIMVAWSNPSALVTQNKLP
ncbi:MAG: exo-alpha-sialidase [Herpetosiphonaceae bacterium]|nr:exo-alpha-sialidase [Herpetosiphonaceae bacterium]